MANLARASAFVAYLLPIIGPLLILLFNRKNLFAIYHACQSLVLVAILIVIPIVWVVLSWLVSSVPIAGPLLGVSMFTLVMASWLLVLVAWVIGMVNALQGKYQRLPLFGRWGEKVFLYFNAIEETPASQETQEVVV